MLSRFSTNRQSVSKRLKGGGAVENAAQSGIGVTTSAPRRQTSKSGMRRLQGAFKSTKNDRDSYIDGQANQQTMQFAYDEMAGNIRRIDRQSISASYDNEHDISPPSTSGSDRGFDPHNSGDVSPVSMEAEKVYSGPENVTSSHHASMQESAGNDTIFPRLKSNNGNGPTRWDKYTGEITTKSNGKTGSAHNPNSPLHKVIGKLKPTHNVDREQKRRSQESNRPAATAGIGQRAVAKAPWKGPSGRSEIMPPLLNITGRRADIENSTRQPDPSPVNPVNVELGEGLNGDLVGQESRIWRSATQTMPYEQEHSDERRESLDRREDGRADAVTQDFRRASIPRRPVSISSVASSVVRRKAVPSKVLEGPPRVESLRAASESRFSWTTDETTNTPQLNDEIDEGPQTPRANGGDITPRNATFSHGDSDVDSSPNSSIIPSRAIRDQYTFSGPPKTSHSDTSSTKAYDGVRNVGLGIDSIQFAPPSRDRQYTPSIAPSIDTQSGTGKALPPPPPALEAESLIDELEARMADLSTQRRNLRRVLEDFNASQPENPMVTDFKTRREKEQRLALWKEEMDEIEKAEHDVGLRLTRAWRRKDDAEGNERTTLWVRRVTH